MLIVALPGGARLAAGLAQSLRCDWTELALHSFPDGETLVRIDAAVKGRCVVLAGSLNQPDSKTLPLLFAADAARELGASQVGLAAPYLAYMRQDRRFNAGEAVTSRSYARLLSTSLDFLVTVDPHLHRWHSLQELYPIRTRAVASAPAIARWLQDHVKAPLVVGPDEESEQWVSDVAHRAGAPWTVMAKTRHGDHDVAVRAKDAGPWTGRTPVLLDDIVSTGRTLLAATQALKEAGLAAPLCICVHALFDADALWRLLGAGVSGVISCDAIAHASNAISLVPALAEAVREMAGDMPARPTDDFQPSAGNVIAP
ncbi:MAG TPA: ribose-phosphate pyrophosphokinase [Ramlibacter sp.]|nr:ribose-phosphate pyrophosphokinase [Ramlibacter sp.]